MLAGEYGVPWLELPIVDVMPALGPALASWVLVHVHSTSQLDAATTGCRYGIMGTASAQPEARRVLPSRALTVLRQNCVGRVQESFTHNSRASVIAAITACDDRCT